MCFHLAGDFSEKDGQLAHIDRDRGNGAEGNLVFLCLVHHNEYDARPSQAKGWLPAELTEIKRRFLQEIAEGRHLASQRATGRGQETDRKALEQLQATMEIPLRFLRGVGFAGHSFVYWEMDGLGQVVRNAVGAEHEFIDHDLETLRQDLVLAGRAFFDAVFFHTQRVPYNHRCRAVPRDWETEQPERFREAVSVLDAAAVEVCDAYDGLLRLGRARLLP